MKHISIERKLARFRACRSIGSAVTMALAIVILLLLGSGIGGITSASALHQRCNQKNPVARSFHFHPMFAHQTAWPSSMAMWSQPQALLPLLQDPFSNLMSIDDMDSFLNSYISSFGPCLGTENHHNHQCQHTRSNNVAYELERDPLMKPYTRNQADEDMEQSLLQQREEAMQREEKSRKEMEMEKRAMADLEAQRQQNLRKQEEARVCRTFQEEKQLQQELLFQEKWPMGQSLLQQKDAMQREEKARKEMETENRAMEDLEAQLQQNLRKQEEARVRRKLQDEKHLQQQLLLQEKWPMEQSVLQQKEDAMQREKARKEMETEKRAMEDLEAQLQQNLRKQEEARVRRKLKEEKQLQQELLLQEQRNAQKRMEQQRTIAELEGRLKEHQTRNNHQQDKEKSIRIGAVELPGYSAEDLSVTVRAGRAVVRGKKPCSCEEACAWKEFERSYPVPAGTGSVRADLVEGLLTISGQPRRVTLQDTDREVPVHEPVRELTRNELKQRRLGQLCAEKKQAMSGGGRKVTIDKRTGRRYGEPEWSAPDAPEVVADEDVIIEVVQ